MNEALEVLIIEDDPDVALGCQQALQLEGIVANCAPSAEIGALLIDPDFRGIVVSDIRLPGQDGISLQRQLHAADPELPVVLITGHGDISMAVQAMKDGAYDFLQKPFAPERFVEIVRRALDKRQLTIEVRSLRKQLTQRDALDARLIGDSSGIVKVRKLIEALAASETDVLIHGETGTGKELVARCLHDTSARRGGNFVAINCGGLPEALFESEIFGHEAGAYTGAAKRRIGKIEYANGGTLFLDEIESMPMSMQVKLLRVLQERTLERLGSNTPIAIDCRIIAATKDDLPELARQKAFRADLYYRLSVATLQIPPLRDRREDIPLLFEYFLAQSALRQGRPVPAQLRKSQSTLMSYAWPGNVRELRNVADRCVLGIEIGSPPFDEPVSDMASSLSAAVEEFERALILDALRKHGSLARTAEFLAIPKTTLHDKIRKYEIAL